MNLSKALNGFTYHMLAEGFSENTIQVYTWGISLLINHLKNPEIKQITDKKLNLFMVWLRKDYKPKRPGGDTSPLSPASIENVWIAIRSFYNWAEDEFDIVRPDSKIKRPRYKSPVISPLTNKEITEILAAIRRKTHKQKDRDRAIVLTLLDTGLRVSELARIRVVHVSIDEGKIKIEPHGTGTKTKGRSVYIGKATRRALWRYLSKREDIHPNDPLFLTNRYQSMSRNNIRFMLYRLSAVANIPNVYPHRFRHTFAIQFLRNGGDVFTLQRLLGHSTLEMVKRYLAIADSDSANVHKGASPVDRWRL